MLPPERLHERDAIPLDSIDPLFFGLALFDASLPRAGGRTRLLHPREPRPRVRRRLRSSDARVATRGTRPRGAPPRGISVVARRLSRRAHSEPRLAGAYVDLPPH